MPGKDASKRLGKGAPVGPYVIVEPIGSGGMGQVYRARDPRLGRDVAIKVLAKAPDADRLARFEREAQSTAALTHPNILTIYDVGWHDGLPFLVCELLEGETLRERLAGSPIEPRSAVELALALTTGVAAAHALRIVHRDLKPENLYLTKDGTLKILDFGLAKLRPDPVPAPELTTLEVTRAGSLVGTPAYMAPEQIRGAPVDGRADLFAVGAILYEMLAGRSPFRKATPAETLAAILTAAPPPFEHRARGFERLERVVFRCLEKDPAERFQTAGDLVLALKSLASELDGTAAPSPERKRGDPPSSVAVLPFTDMSPARDQDWLCEGIAEELINALTHVEGLQVAARSSSFQFRAHAADVRAIGARLGVATVLDGSVRKMGDRLRITVQLVDVADGYHRWSQRFDRTVADVFAIQDEIAENVAKAMRGILTSQEREALRRPGTAVEAYEYFLRGRQLLQRWRRVAMDQARVMFVRALEIDPGYAPAWAGLAHLHAWLCEWWGGGDEDLAAAENASRKALEQAPGLAEAHTARAFVLALGRRFDEADREFEEGIRLNPNSFEAHYVFARACFAQGRIEKSTELFRGAGDVRPEDFQSYILLSQSLQELGRVEEAEEARREGIRRAERQLELDPTDVRALSLGSITLYEMGQNEKGLAWSRRSLELDPDDQAVLVNAACLRAKMGLKDEALDLLERVFNRGYGKRDWIEHDPDYDNLRDDPRFQAMIEKLH